MKGKIKINATKIRGMILPIILIIIWQVFSSVGIFEKHLLPGPIVVMGALIELLKTGELITHVLATTYRVLSGFLIGASIAIIFGTLTGYYTKAFELCDPLIQALRTIPSLAWVPLFILWLGIGESSKLSLIAVGVFLDVAKMLLYRLVALYAMMIISPLALASYFSPVDALEFTLGICSIVFLSVSNKVVNASVYLP